MPDLATLELLLAIARTGSFSAAGRELQLSQQAVSARIASLEARVGVTLVMRSARGARLTPAGAVAAEWADRLLHVAHEVDTGLASLRGDSRHRIRISASMTIAEQLLPTWLVSLKAAARQRGTAPPDVELTATNSDHVAEQVSAGDADVGFVEGPIVPNGLRSKVVAHDELVVVVPANHRWTRKKNVTAEELRDTPLVAREPGSGTRDWLTAALTHALGAHVHQATPALELSTASSVCAAVVAGAGPAVLSRLSVSDDLAAGRLREVPVSGLDLHRQLRAVWVGGRTPPAGAVRDFLAHIASSAAPG